MSKKKPDSRRRGKSSLISMGISLLVGVVIGLMGVVLILPLSGDSDLLYFVYLGVYILGLIIAAFTQIIIHEAGHLVFGRMTGYEFLSFNIFGLIWSRRRDGKLRMKRMKIAGAGGQCLMAPPEYNGGDFPFTLYNLGGVLANLLTAALFGLLAWLIPLAPLQLLLWGQTIMGVLFAAINGLPIPTGAIQNDGKNLLCISRSMHARRAFWVQMALAAEMTRGKRLREMPDEWFAPFPEEEMNNPIVCTIAVQQASRLMDQLNFPAALEAINALLKREKGVMGLYRMSLSCDGAVCELISGAPGPLTAALEEPEIAQMMKAMKTNPTILRTQYALALLRDRNAEQAQTQLNAFRAAVRSHPYAQEGESENEIILAIQSSLLTGEGAE